MSETKNQHHGLYDNQQFIDHLYRYGEINNDMKVKKDAENVATSSKEMERNMEICAKHRVTSVNICLSKIKSTTQEHNEWQTYFNYIRWNRKTISEDLNSYLRQPCLEKHHAVISACHQLMDYVMNEYCNFTHTDEAIFSEYRHVFNMLSGERRQRSVLLQAGRLFVNFIDILSRRYYYNETDIKFSDIEMQASVIVDKLSSNGYHSQSDTVKIAHEDFVKLREMEDVRRTIDRELLTKALKLAHARATESVLQAAKRIILESISKVQKKLRDGLRTAITVGELIVHPFLHPVETAKNVWSALLHPMDSLSALLTWAKESPWKCGAIVAGGLCLGAVAFGGAAIAFDYFVMDIAATAITPLLAGGGFGGVVIPLSVATNRANQLIKTAEKEESELRRKFNSFKSDINAQGDDIAEQAISDENGDWWAYANSANRESQAAKEILQQIDVMDEEKLRQSESELSGYIPAVESGLADAHRVVEEITESISHDREDSEVMRRASEIMREKISATSRSSDNFS